MYNNSTPYPREVAVISPCSWRDYSYTATSASTMTVERQLESTTPSSRSVKDVAIAVRAVNEDTDETT